MNLSTVDAKTITLVDAKAHRSELTELAAAGEIVIITKRGKPVARVSRPERPREQKAPPGNPSGASLCRAQAPQGIAP